MDYLVKMIRDGGEKQGRSKYMPPFKDELSNEQIKKIQQIIKRERFTLNSTCPDERYTKGVDIKYRISGITTDDAKWYGTDHKEDLRISYFLSIQYYYLSLLNTFLKEMVDIILNRKESYTM